MYVPSSSPPARPLLSAPSPSAALPAALAAERSSAQPEAGGGSNFNIKCYFILKSVNIKYKSLFRNLSVHNIVHVNYLVYAYGHNQNPDYFAELREEAASKQSHFLAEIQSLARGVEFSCGAAGCDFNH